MRLRQGQENWVRDLHYWASTRNICTFPNSTCHTKDVRAISTSGDDAQYHLGGASLCSRLSILNGLLIIPTSPALLSGSGLGKVFALAFSMNKAVISTEISLMMSYHWLCARWGLDELNGHHLTQILQYAGRKDGNLKDSNYLRSWVMLSSNGQIIYQRLSSRGVRHTTSKRPLAKIRFLSSWHGMGHQTSEGVEWADGFTVIAWQQYYAAKRAEKILETPITSK